MAQLLLGKEYFVYAWCLSLSFESLGKFGAVKVMIRFSLF
jgi:hypothetical protein